MEDYPICLGSVIKANCIKFKLNMNLYELNRGILTNEMKNMLDYSGCISVENYFNKLKKISENKDYIKICIDEESKRIMKIFQKMMSLNMLNRDIFDKEYKDRRPDICKQADPELEYCQIIGKYKSHSDDFKSVRNCISFFLNFFMVQ